MPKVKVPDGRGGFVETEAEMYPGETADVVRQEKRLTAQQSEDFWKRVGSAAEKFNALEKALGTERGLTEDEMVAAKYMDLLNWQHFFPKELGGSNHVKELCLAVQAEFERQLKA